MAATTRTPRLFIRRLIDLPRGLKRLICLTVDSVAIAMAIWAAFALDQSTLRPVISGGPLPFAVALVGGLYVFARLGLYRAIVRFVGLKAFWTVLAGVTAAAVCLAVAEWLYLGSPPVAAVVIFWALALVYVASTRFLASTYFNSSGSSAERVAIVGAGETGVRLAAALRAGRQFSTVLFVDDSPQLRGSQINGVDVCGLGALRDEVVAREVERVLLALPRESRRRRNEILRLIEGLKVHVQTVPDLGEIVSGRARVEELREIEVEDLLGRDPVPPNERLVDACIRRKTVMVTGAGGSIGSELCRQILRQGPRRLVLFEMSELALYNIERELKTVADAERLDVQIVGLLGNAHHKHRVREVLAAFGVQTVYHAAAYKHVPIVEENIIEGIHNNVIATWYTAEAAMEVGVETFVLISTDKAVNPTNVMGATKRFAEIVLQALQQTTRRTRFCMVRFGNVLASSGSVVPLFQEQIRAGGPVTVTHADVQRYFMTIPEAAGLVLQAGSMGQGGDVFVLDMGKPVRIAELARRMIVLAGYTVRDEQNPGGEIEIRFTGLRAAEKLYEELLIGNNVTGTEHPMIMRAMEHTPTWEEALALLKEMTMALHRSDCQKAREILARAVREYLPADQLYDLVWSATHGRADAPSGRETGSVVRFRPGPGPSAGSTH